MRTNPASYETDVIAWANEQARLLRAGRFDALDIEHIADEIEDVGKSEKREFASRMAVLLTHMLKWQYQPAGQGNSWRRTIKEQRNRVRLCIDQTPSLKAELRDSFWWSDVWSDAVAKASEETGSGEFPESCPWTFDQIMNPEFWPASLD
jgi:hypothetical protein